MTLCSVIHHGDALFPFPAMVPVVNQRYDSLSFVVVHTYIGTLELGSSTLTSSIECPINSTMGIQGSDPILGHLYDPWSCQSDY